MLSFLTRATPLIVALLSAVLSQHTNTRAAVPFFEFSSGVDAYDEAYDLAMEEMSQNVENGAFIAGAGWKQLWTRDISYAVELGAGLVFPDVAQRSLEKCTEQDPEFESVWLQDECVHFGGWPNLTDAIVGVRGAWSLYLTSGNEDFLSWAYSITTNSLKRAERDAYDPSTGLFLGCSSFMESNSGYPKKYRNNGELVRKTKALSTNMLHYAGYKLGAQMAQELGRGSNEIHNLNRKAKKLRAAIRSRLWSSNQGFYSYFEDEDQNLAPQSEGLGEALLLLAPAFEDRDRIDSIFRNTHRVLGRGLPCLWPPFNLTGAILAISDYYHNGRIWPFVQGYWSIAAARHDKVKIFEQELTNLLWLSQRGNTFAEFYEANGTFLENRSRQLWSDTGFLSMVFHGLFGMTFSPEGITFDPVKPGALFPKQISLKGLRYRKATLDIYVSGSGWYISSFAVNGKRLPDPFIPCTLEGTHTIEISLKSSVGGDASGDTALVRFAIVLSMLLTFFGAVVFVRNGAATRLYNKVSAKDESKIV